MSCWSLIQDIEKILIKLEGFESLDDCYRLSNCNHVLYKVNFPLFFLSTLDDLFVGTKKTPRARPTKKSSTG